jgi:poly(beta-D-mannuronate) C5 epimerase
VSEVQLKDMPSVFIGAQGGTLSFNGVVVRSIPGDDLAASNYYQPFVMATGKTTMNTTDSTFTGLGWDWNASYGVSWVEGATGRATGSTFTNSFIGVYTNGVSNLTFEGDKFTNNALYGLDPHTYSSHLTISHVTASGNKAHGIIFSNNVTASSITDSYSFKNGENGIMMDARSTGNRIIDNTVYGNTGDGLVTADSPNNAFANNVVTSNRVGLRLDASDTSSTTLTGNRFHNNGIASEGVAVIGTNVASDNGGQWNWTVIKRTWLVAMLLILLIALLLRINMRRNMREQRRTLALV